MKRYFNFNLSGKEILPLYLLSLAFVIVPYGIMFLGIKPSMSGRMPGAFDFLLIFIGFVALFIAIIALYILWGRKLICAVGLEETRFKFEGSIPTFIGINLLGIFLTLITLGIYMPWYIKKVTKYYLGEISRKDKRIDFQGAGFELLLIIVLALIIPSVVLSVVLMKVFGVDLTIPESAQNVWYQLSSNILSYVVLVPYFYLQYKWYVDFKISVDQTITWETKFFPSCLKILIELLLIIVTFGIYYPVAMLRLYSYFLPLTVMRKGTVQYAGNFGFEGKYLEGFLLIWAQILLSIITLGFYLPWAISKIYGWVLSQTYYNQAQEAAPVETAA